MKMTVQRVAKAGIPVMARDARRRLHAMPQTLRPVATQDIFSDREKDAVEYDSIVRDFETARDEALSAERYN